MGKLILRNVLMQMLVLQLINISPTRSDPYFFDQVWGRDVCLVYIQSGSLTQ